MAIAPLLNAPDMMGHKGFLLAEDEALKTYLTGIQVPKSSNEPDVMVDVPVWYRWPVGERQIKYPFITIDSLSAEPAFELFHSDHRTTVPPSEKDWYVPDKTPLMPQPPGGWQTQQYGILNYLPFRLLYQVTHFARTNLHDRYLRSIFMTDVFPVRPFWIACDADQTWRRTEQVGFAAADESETSESGTKRIFRKIYTVSMLAEIPQERLEDSVFYKVFRVWIRATDRQGLDEYFQVAHEGHEVPTAM